MTHTPQRLINRGSDYSHSLVVLLVERLEEGLLEGRGRPHGHEGREGGALTTLVVEGWIRSGGVRYN
jgi:hypothetical protein